MRWNFCNGHIHYFLRNLTVKEFWPRYSKKIVWVFIWLRVYIMPRTEKSMRRCFWFQVFYFLFICTANLVVEHNVKLNGCIVRNAHNTVFGSKRSDICALAVYFVHSTRPSVTWLNSRSSLAACDWVMSALSAVPSTRVRRRIKWGCVLVRNVQTGNDFELIPTVKMETRRPVEGSFSNEFP